MQAITSIRTLAEPIVSSIISAVGVATSVLSACAATADYVLNLVRSAINVRSRAISHAPVSARALALNTRRTFEPVLRCWPLCSLHGMCPSAMATCRLQMSCLNHVM